MNNIKEKELIKQLDIATVRNINYEDGNQPTKSLQEYEAIAKRIVKKNFTSGIIKKVLNNDDALANITHSIIEADVLFDGRGNLEGFRSQYVKWFISNIKYRATHTKNNNLSLDLTSVLEEEESFDNLSRMKGIDRSSSLMDITLKEEAKSILHKKLVKVLDSANLTEKERSCIEHAYFDGLTVKNIAKMKGVSRQAIHDNLKRGVEKIKPLIKQDKFFEEYF